MPTLVGDLIIAARSIIPDMPGTLPTPAAPAVSFLLGGSLPIASATYVVTALNQWGESDASPGTPASAVFGSQTAHVVITAVPGATHYRVYIGNQYWESTSPTIDIASLATASIGVQPIVNRAWVPDTDGAVFPAITLYGWIREALKLAADITGGLYDATGVCTVNGTAMYQLPTGWKKMTHAWWDGWQLGLGNKGDAFYRNKTTATSGIVFTDLRGKTAVIEYYPVPSRSGGQTVLTAPINATTPIIPVSTTSNFFLAYGLAIIDTEIVAYQALTGGSLTGCLRGLGGSAAAAHTPGAVGQVQELNGRFAGYRYPIIPRPGDSALDLDIHDSWDAHMPLYIESRYRETERRFKEAQSLRNDFVMGLKASASSMRMLTGPRQIGEQYVNEVYGSGAKAGGGWLLP